MAVDHVDQLKYGFLSLHRLLVERIEPDGLLPMLISEAVVTEEEKAIIQNEITSSQQVDKLLTAIHRHGASDPDVYARMLKAMRDAFFTLGQDLRDLADAIEADSAKDEVVKRFHLSSGNVLEESHNAALRTHSKVIASSLRVEEVLPRLVSAGAISVEENDAIRTKKIESERAVALLRFISEKGSLAFAKFAAALLESESYQHLGKLLSKGDPYLETLVKVEGNQQLMQLLSVEETLDDEIYMAEVLKRGHVPPRQGVYVERKQMTEKIRKELRRLKDEDGWVVVHGIAGFGKTVLAAEAVRDAELLRDVFPGGVFWLTVGQMTDYDGEIDNAQLLTKMQNLILRLDESHYRPPNLEEASDYLQKVLTEQHPRSLLILDDVWSPDVAQAFGVRCRTMVTSRNQAVASSVPTPRIYPVSVSEGFSEEEGKILLSLWLRTDPQSLPLYADTILHYCRGSPFAIALIGAMLRKNAREAKWKAIAEKLEAKHVSAIHLRAAVNDWNYQHPTLNASMELSVESLPDHLKEFFEMFVVFDYDTIISSDALATIWGLDSLDAEEYMEELIGYSLAQEGNPGSQDSDFLLFFIHDIILDYLRDTVSKKRQVELHAKVVQRYSEKCNGAYSSLPSDHYVHQKLLSHVAAAGNQDLLGDLMSNLLWLIASVRYGDPNTVLGNYRMYKSHVSKQFMSGVQQFELFVSGHMYVLTSSPSKEDIVQLALLLPDTSEVYLQAATLARGDRKKSWFKWSNKESDPEKYVLKLKVHHGGIMRCQYSEDGSRVASCSIEGDVKVWDSSTGMILGDFKGHKNHVTCCALSRSGKLVVSASEDCTVKVWDGHHKRLLVDFTEHKYGVQCCDLSPDEGFVVSADVDSCVMVWEVHTGTVRAKWRLGVLSPLASPMDSTEHPLTHTSTPPSRSSSNSSQGGNEGVSSCAFAPSGDCVLTASQSGAIRLWTLKGQLVRHYSGHCGIVRCVVFSHDGKLLASACLGDCTAKIWDVDVGECLQTLSHSAAVLSCDFSPDASRLITGDVEGYVKFWSVRTGVLLQDLMLHFDYVNCVLYSPTGQHILSAADNGLVKILWSENGEEEEQSQTVQYHRRFSIWFEKLGAVYQPVIVCQNLKSKKLEIVGGASAETVVSNLPTITGLTVRSWQISNTGTMIAVGYLEGTLQMLTLTHSEKDEWEVKESWRKENAHDGSILKCYFVPDDSKIISCSLGQHKSWSAASGKELAVISGRGTGVRLCVLFTDSIRAASAQEDGVLIWSTGTGIPQLKCKDIVEGDGSILCVNLSQDNSRLIASATSGLVVVWSADKGEILMKSKLMPMTPCARSCALSPDGSYAAAGFDDGSLKIWTVSHNPDVNYRPTGSDYWMIDVAFSPDGRQIVTLCDSIVWWKVDGSHSKTLLLKGAFGKYIRFSPDFQTFVTIDNAGLLYVLTPLAE